MEPPAGVTTLAAAEKPAPNVCNPRVLFITAQDCEKCERELGRLRSKDGEFDKLVAQGWKIGTDETCHLQIVAASLVVAVIEQLDSKKFPVVACVDNGQIVRSYQSGCTTPLDAWTFGWLAKGINERPAAMVGEKARVETTGHYPLRGNHWSVDDDWSPSREKVLAHLHGPNHAFQVARYGKIESWSYEELRSLHDNLHEVEMGGVSYSSASRSQSAASTFSATRKFGGK